MNKNLIYYFEYIYNCLLDYLDLTPNNICDTYINSYIQNKPLIIDLINDNRINTINLIINLRWNMFYRKYKRT
jgi:hypothetical protein